ncbi:outer membrane beta-barrel protein [Archangium violaceum]|uniref:outer membrane beta-barrel protein n=1 Tax=Archangium violaceum TaxID=83451 RepID=UPI00193C1B51|nr:outer membrane beta-barrel protein [Archangium violaceum]QRK11710.1 outer membrane beta-barrel protein [Archangium violaceum]
MTKKLVAGVAVLSLWAGSAMAQDRQEANADMRGLSVLIGGGVEGYTYALGQDINPGLAYGATLVLKPTKVVGLELGYSGAANNFDTQLPLTGNGPDVLRNGAQAVATVGLTAAPLQPYVLAGLGVSNYNVRNAAPGFQDDNVGLVPVGAGLRLYIGDFTADARVNYNLLFDQEFAAVPPADVDLPGDETFSAGGSYTGTLNLGATW